MLPKTWPANGPFQRTLRYTVGKRQHVRDIMSSDMSHDGLTHAPAVDDLRL